MKDLTMNEMMDVNGGNKFVDYFIFKALDTVISNTTWGDGSKKPKGDSNPSYWGGR